MLATSIVKILLDNIEYLERGLCTMDLKNHNIDPINVGIIRRWINDEIPTLYYFDNKISEDFYVYSWPQGSVDHRYYWLKSKLKEYENN